MRKTDQYFTLWHGEELKKVLAGNLPYKNSPLDLQWSAGEMDQIIFQLNNNLYLFTLDELPPGSRVSAGMLQAEGLHTRNHGGVRLRIETQRITPEINIKLRFRVLS